MSPGQRTKTALMPWYRECLVTSPLVAGGSGSGGGAAAGAPSSAIDGVFAASRSEPADEAREWREERYARLWARAAAYTKKVETEGTKFKMDDVVFHTPTKEVTDFVTFHPAEPRVRVR